MSESEVTDKKLGEESFFVDSHCHLNLKNPTPKNADEESKIRDGYYAADAQVRRANDAGVKYMLTICTVLSEADLVQSIAEAHDGVFCSVGIHPQEAMKHFETYSREDMTRIIREHAAQKKTVAIGEIGLDYHFERDSEKYQKDLFEMQLDLAEKCGLSVSIHSRDAIDDTVAILKNHPKVRGVIHCFSGEMEFAKDSLDIGYYIGVGGSVTFKNSGMLRETAKFIPKDRLVLETDAPFLAPVPMRGKTNEPAFIPMIAAKIAEIWKTDTAEVGRKTSRNFFDVFGIES